MPKKCESCRFYRTDEADETCERTMSENPLSVELATPLYFAREFCDREGDGVFVYFEPKEPHAGAAVEQSLRAAA